MANINKLFTLGWHASYQDDDVDVNISSFSGSIKTTFAVRQSGNGFDQTEPGNSFATYLNFESGSAYYVQLESGQTASVQIMVLGTQGGDAGRITTLYPMSFVLDPDGINSEYQMTTEFQNGKPVYKSSSTGRELRFDGTEYTTDLPVTVGNTLENREFKNGSCLPNAPYSRVGENDYVTDSHFVEVSGLTGDKSTVNGSYYEVGSLHGEKSYRHSGCVDYFYYKGTSQWILSDTPYNATGCHVTGEADKLSCVNPSNGHSCFDGQSACVFDGDVDPRSLVTEDDISLLGTEDKLRVIITEAEL